MAEPRCETCGTSMVEGFLLDRTYGANLETRWFEGRPEKSWLGAVKRLKGRRDYPVSAFRCERCGRVQLFAQ